MNHLITEEAVKRAKSEQSEVIVLQREGLGYRPYEPPQEPERAFSPVPPPPVAQEITISSESGSASDADEETDTELELETNDVFTQDPESTKKN